jgi:hypothetical protein
LNRAFVKRLNSLIPQRESNCDILFLNRLTKIAKKIKAETDFRLLTPMNNFNGELLSVSVEIASPTPDLASVYPSASLGIRRPGLGGNGTGALKGPVSAKRLKFLTA